MDYSNASKVRSFYMSKMEVPTMSVISQQLGEHLSQVMFCSCPEPLKDLIGLTPLLKSVNNELWTSPSDLLIGKVCLKPPLTSTYLQALTHKGIIEIGIKVEEKFINEMEIARLRGLQEQEQIMRYIFDKEIKEAIQRTIEEEQKSYAEMMKNIKSEFEEKLQEQLKAVETAIFMDSGAVVDDPQDDKINIPWKEKHNETIMTAVKLLTREFLEDLAQQKVTLTSHFKEIIKRTKLQCGSILIERQMRYKDMMRHLKHYLECKNIANMMYILCTERRKCQAERKQAEQFSWNEVRYLNKKIIKQDNEIKDLRKKLEKKKKILMARELCLIRVLQQFQKFINFVLKAAPTQAEFLLNIEQIARLELNDNLDDNTNIKLSADLIQPLNNTTASIPKSSSSNSTSPKIKDNQNCYNEIDITIENSSISEQPIVYYNNRMYVREDFRDMLLADIKNVPNNILWSEDVAKLLKLMKKSVKDDDTDDDEIDVSVIGSQEVLVEKKNIPPGHLKEKKNLVVTGANVGKTEAPVFTVRRSSGKAASVHFDPDYFSDYIENEKKIGTTVNLNEETKSVLSNRFYPVPEFINHEALGCNENTPLLLASSDSLDLILKTRVGEKWRKKSHQKKDELDQETQTSDILSDHQHEFEEMTLQVITPVKTQKKRKFKRRKFVSKTATKSTSAATINAVEKVRAAIEMKTHPGIEDITSHTTRRCSYKLEVKDSLIKHRRSLVPKIEEDELEVKKDTIDVITKTASMSKHSKHLMPAKESFLVKQNGESKLDLARDSLEIARKRRDSAPSSNVETYDYNIREEEWLSVGRDSLQTLGESMVKGTEVTSKLELARDSLEIIKKATSKMSYSERKTSVVERNEEFLIPNCDTCDLSENTRKPTSVIIFDHEDALKTVKMSHVEILELNDSHGRSKICFYPQPKYIDPNLEPITHVPEDIYKTSGEDDKRKEVEFLQKPKRTKVVGDRNDEEYLEKEDEFILHRINSFTKLFKKNPSMIKMFSSVRK